MFRSHLDFPHVASGTSHLPSALGADPTTPSVPAPVAGSGDMIKRVALIGGIAVIVFLILRHLSKSKSSE